MKQWFISELGILFRAFCYFSVPSLAVFADQIKPYADSGKVPTVMQGAYISALAAGAGLVALRAFYDGAAQRHQDKKATENGHDTTIQTKL